MNNRLASLSDEIGLLSSAQAGFRNAHSTADNIFILHSLINLYLSKGRNCSVHKKEKRKGEVFSLCLSPTLQAK
jgi:hypothetical protein